MAFNFTGSASRAEHATATGLDVDQISFCFWFYATASTDFATLFTAGPAAPQSIWIHRDIGNGGISFRYYRSTQRGQWCSNTFSNNEWVCLCISYDRTSTANVPTMYLRRVGTDLSLQIDSAPDEIRAPSGTVTAPSGGYSLSDNEFPWVGREAHVQVWNRILTQGEFETASHRPGSVPRGLIIFPKDDGTDLTGNGFNLTLTDTTVGDNPPVSPLIIGSGWMGAATAASGVTGTLARTNANDALAASGTTTVTGAAAATNAADTGAATGTTTVTGSLAATNASDSLAASGTTAVLGSLATTNANDSLSAAGSTTVTGSLAPTNADDTLSASGTAGTPTGTVAVTNANDSLAASGTTAITGSAATTNGNDTLSASGQASLEQGGGGGKKRKPFKSWDQRQREREAEIKAQQEAVAARLARENRDKYGDLPPALEKELVATASTEKQKPLSAHTMREYERVRLNGDRLRNDDEEAFALILGLL